MKNTTILFSLLAFLVSSCTSTTTDTTTASNTADSLYSEQHIDFKKWNRDPNTCCEAKGRKIAISSGGPLSSAAGIEIEEAGGNIVDITVATALALNVERPQSTSISGGGFLTLHLANGTNAFVDFRETAPRKANAKLYLDAAGEPIPKATVEGGKAVATPGMIAGLYDIHKKWGKLSWKRVVQPSIRIARSGFTLYPTIAEKIEARKGYFSMSPYAKSLLFGKDGLPLKVGDLFVQTDLANTLEAIANGGKNAFYSGEIAARIVKTVTENGGVLDETDLKNYRVKFRTPIRSTFKGYTILTAPPPSAGGVLMAEMFNILEPYDLKQISQNPAQYVHLLSEVMKRGYADRSDLIGDPDTLTTKKGNAYPALLTQSYADKARKEINTTSATPWDKVRPGAFLPKQTHGTTHLSIIDSQGNAVTATLTLNIGNFGSGLAVDGTGIFLNNEMDDFTLLPGRKNSYGLVSSEINSIQPKRRPVSSMTPTIVLKNGKPVLAVGGAGGSKIISAVFQVTLNTLFVYDGDLKKAVFAPRAHHQWLPDKLDLENGFSESARNQLTKMGHELTPPAWTADVEAVYVTPDETLVGVYDPRNQGGVAAK